MLEWDLPFARWFDGGTLNVSYNCLDRHVAAGRGDKVAFHWEGEPGDTRTITYAELLTDVSTVRQRAARPRVSSRGDRVAIYMPMIPELPVAMLACTRIGAVHSVVFGGFSSDALRDRILDAAGPGGDHRRRRMATRGRRSPSSPTSTPPWLESPCVEHVVVARRIGDDGRRQPPMTDGRDHWWHELLSGDDPAAGGAPSDDCPPEHMEAEDLLYILYTSGTTAAPKGIMHTTGRLSDPGGLHPPGRLRPPSRAATSTGARPTSAG